MGVLLLDNLEIEVRAKRARRRLARAVALC
jgi:hypothetical protein